MYSSTPGLSINASTGAVNLGASTPGIYTVTYTVAAGGGCASFSTTAVITIAAVNSWIGVVSSDWNNAGNWCGGIPTTTMDVTIPAVAPNMPLLGGGTGNARNVLIITGGSVTVGTGGTLNLYGDIYANGTFNSSAGNLAFRGSGIQKVPAFTAINVTKDGPGSVLLMGNATITGDLTMNNGHIMPAGYNITLSGNGTGSAASHIIMDNGSVVNLIGLAAGNSRTIPIGTNGASYTPLTFIANTGHITDNFAVRVDPGVFVDGVSGATYPADVVDRTWSVTEGTAGGSNADLRFEWSPLEEMFGFDRVRSQVIRLGSGGWIEGPISGSGGAGPYTQSLTGVSSFGKFAVRSESLRYTSSGILYPNPARTTLNIVLNLPSESVVMISIFDSKGSLVQQQQASVNANLSRTEINIDRLIPGTYLVMAAMGDKEIFSERFVKLR